MAVGLLDKLTNFLMPIEEPVESSTSRARSKPAHLRVHSNMPEELRMIVIEPHKYEDVRLCAGHLKTNVAIIVNFEATDYATQQSMSDFLDGVCYVIDGTVEKISERVLLYVPATVEINKRLCAYSIPTYVKQSD
ncbi:MAG: cell division protein SepF [Veillonellales bacterium]